MTNVVTSLPSHTSAISTAHLEQIRKRQLRTRGYMYITVSGMRLALWMSISEDRLSRPSLSKSFPISEPQSHLISSNTCVVQQSSAT